MKFMKLINQLVILVVLLMLGCANQNKYKLEKHVDLDFVETYYEKWAAGAVGAGSGYRVFISINSLNADDSTIELIGIYFKEQYAELQIQEDNRYRAFIKGDENSENVDIMIGGEELDMGDEANEHDIPFDLEPEEAVVALKTNSKLKYFKLLLVEKKVTDKPM